MRNWILQGIFAIAIVFYFFFLGQETKHYLNPAPKDVSTAPTEAFNPQVSSPATQVPESKL